MAIIIKTRDIGDLLGLVTPIDSPTVESEFCTKNLA